MRIPGVLKTYAVCVIVLLISTASAMTAFAARPSHPELRAQTRRFINDQRILLRRDARGMAELRRALSARFYRSLSLAFEEDRQSQALHPGDKPGHSEFTFICADGSFDGYAIEAPKSHSGSSASVIVSFYDQDGGGTYWKDRYEWVREQGVWRLDDIECEIDHPDQRSSLRRGIGH